jgi:hypothetical protein
VYAITIGDLEALSTVITGGATVAGDLSHGQLEPMLASSAGSSVVSGDLDIRPYQYLEGVEVGDNDLPMGPAGLRRAHFSPKSVGYVNERASTQAYGTGTITTGPGS